MYIGLVRATGSWRQTDCRGNGKHLSADTNRIVYIKSRGLRMSRGYPIFVLLLKLEHRRSPATDLDLWIDLGR